MELYHMMMIIKRNKQKKPHKKGKEKSKAISEAVTTVNVNVIKANTGLYSVGSERSELCIQGNYAGFYNHF